MLLDQSYKVDELGTVSEGAVLIPESEYMAKLVRLEGKDTKTGGKMAVLDVRITHGEYQGTELIDRLNVINDNPDAVRIALNVLADICRSQGLTETPRDLSTLVGSEFIIKVKTEKGADWIDDKGETVAGKDKSIIAKYKARTVSNPPAQQSAPAQQQPAQQQSAQQQVQESQPAQVNAPAENPFAA